MRFFLIVLSALAGFSGQVYAQQKEVGKQRKSDLVEVMVDAANSRFFYFSS
ncbi:MAG: hypothetical protein RLZZ172_1431, partial [Bacteroidota bacterium]